MALTGSRTFFIMVLLGGLAAVLFWLFGPFSHNQSGSVDKERGRSAVPVEARRIEHGTIELQRTFSGALEPRAEFIVAPKVSGRLETLTVNISDKVNRGEQVAELDNDEYIQAVAQAKADLAVARANLAEARSALEVADRELERVTTLRKRGVASEAQLDSVTANQLAKQVEQEVALAHVTRAESALETANIRLGYTRITAGWSGGADHRVVAERYVDEGEMVSANTPLVRIVELDPITGVLSVTERDYAFLQTGQEVTLVTDAFSGEIFTGRIERIAPVFKVETRQARVELTIENALQRLKPGMFIRATVVLDRAEDAAIVPVDALSKRDDKTGIFLLSEDGKSVKWRQVATGIRNGASVQIIADGLEGRVVTLGQQLLNDGSAVTVVDDPVIDSQSPEKAGPR